MSRSYKKTPICKDNTKTSHINKKLASRRYRRASEARKVSTHWKRYTNSWDIHDYVSRWSLKQAKEAWEHDSDNWYHKHYGSYENFIQKCWAKYYKRK